LPGLHVNHKGERKHLSTNYLFVVGSRVTTGNWSVKPVSGPI